MQNFLKFIVAFSLSLIITAIIVGVYLNTRLEKIKFTDLFSLEEVYAAKDTNNPTAPSNEKFAAVLFGLDARQEGEHARSDTIMVLLIDHANKKIKLASIIERSVR